MGKLRFTAQDIYDIHWMGIDTGKSVAQVASHFNVKPSTILYVKKNIKRCWNNHVQATKPYRLAIKMIKTEEDKRVKISVEAKQPKVEITPEVAPETNHTNGFSLNIAAEARSEKPEHLRKLEYAFDMFQTAMAEYIEAEFQIKNAAFLKEYAELKDLMDNAKGAALIEKLQNKFHLTA